MPIYTPNFNLAKPLVGDPTDQNLWGGELNTNMDNIDSLVAPLASPAFTGTPTAPTAAAATSTTQVATTAFVTSALTTAGPIKTLIGTVITANGNYTPNAKLAYCMVRMVGAGGGGGGAFDTSSGGGGEAGTYGERLFTVAEITAALSGGVIACTIGTAGTAGANTGGTGGTGGNTVFGSLMTANGGKGGTGLASQPGLAPGWGGNSTAAGTGGTINQPGGPGFTGYGGFVGGSFRSGFGGNGGSSMFAQGGIGGTHYNTTTNNPLIGTGAGAGGGGASADNGVGVTGAAGIRGEIRILEYCTA